MVAAAVVVIACAVAVDVVLVGDVVACAVSVDVVVVDDVVVVGVACCCCCGSLFTN